MSSILHLQTFKVPASSYRHQMVIVNIYSVRDVNSSEPFLFCSVWLSFGISRQEFKHGVSTPGFLHTSLNVKITMISYPVASNVPPNPDILEPP